MLPYSTKVRFVASFSLLLVILSFVIFSSDRALTKDDVSTHNAAALVPTITAVKTATLSTDANGNGVVNPGDVLTYTVTVNNTGTDALNTVFTDVLNSNLTLVPGSVNASPIATNDAYSVLGNVSISIPDGASDLLANDVDPNGNTLTITVAPTTSTAGGNLAINTTTGAFTYNPPAGFEGTDTFTYTVSDGTATNQATVTLTVSGMIFFVNNSAADCTSRAAGCGRLSNPYSSLAAFQAENNGGSGGLNPSAGDNIFIFTGGASYDASLTLLNNQKLIGQGASATLQSISGVTVPPFSTPLPATTAGSNPKLLQPPPRPTPSISARATRCAV